MKTNFIALLIMICACGYAFAQSSADPKYSGNATWRTLANISYEVTEDEYGVLNIPVFSDAIKAMEGKEIEVPGYIIPAGGLEAVFEPRHFILSSLPLAACFFCGVGGAETVVEVYLKEPIEHTEAPIRIKGKLVLNAQDIYQLMYILEEAELIDEVN